MTKRLAIVEETTISTSKRLHPTQNEILGLNIFTLGERQVYFVFDIWATNDGFTDGDCHPPQRWP